MAPLEGFEPNHLVDPPKALGLHELPVHGLVVPMLMGRGIPLAECRDAQSARRNARKRLSPSRRSPVLQGGRPTCVPECELPESFLPKVRQGEAVAQSIQTV